MAEEDCIYNPNHQSSILLLSESGPCWGYHGEMPGVTIREAIQKHLEQIRREELFMPYDDDDLDDDDDEDEE